MLCFLCCCVKLITSTLTSYFCLFSFSLRSNFSASSCIIHCQSSLAFSLREPIRSFVSGRLHNTGWWKQWWDHVQRWLTSVYLQTDDRCWVASSYPPGSSSSSLFPSVSSPLCGPRPARERSRFFLRGLIFTSRLSFSMQFLDQNPTSKLLVC